METSTGDMLKPVQDFESSDVITGVPLQHLPAGKAAPRRATLSVQFLIAGGLVMQIAMLVAGYLITELVSREAIRSKAASTALFMQSLVAPAVQELATSQSLSAGAIARLDQLFADEAVKRRFPYFEVWTPDGVVAYSNTPQIIGHQFDRPNGLLRALTGEVTADHADPRAGEHVIRGIRTRYLEIYSPIRLEGSSRIIAVAEIHEQAEPFREELAALRRSSWLVIAAVTAAIMLALFGIVHRGSRTIETQRKALERRVEETEQLLLENRQLSDRLQRASARVAELNEQFIRGIGADLHDGPAQLISFSILKIEDARNARSKAPRDRSLLTMQSALDEAMREIRSISKGLVLPEIADLPLHMVIERAVRAHEARTRTSVALATTELPQPVSHAVRICVFRFVQEGLNNAYRHGGATGQEVRSWMDGTLLNVSVADSGGDSSSAEKDLPSAGIGLYGLQERVESLGGTLTKRRLGDGGNLLKMTLDLSGGLLVA
ncbi:sensor histidine kinase [Bosea sp. 2YAB26]|uniref:sensor histidine kinase n=1 Tax=Bosea sp. 2YAB26 TaxID=3237478 RepID=UPI003F913527